MSTSGKNIWRRIDWRIKRIFYFHNEIPKWPTKWPTNRKLATIFKTGKVKGDITNLWAILYTHASIYKQTLSFTTFGDDRNSNSRWRSSQPEVPIFQLVEELATRFLIIIRGFWGQTIKWRHALPTLPHHNGRFSRWNSVANMCTSGDMSTSGLAAAILDLSLPVRSDSIVGITVGLLDPKNIGLAVEIALLLCEQLEIPHEEVVTLYTNENVTPSDISPVVPVVS